MNLYFLSHISLYTASGFVVKRVDVGCGQKRGGGLDVFIRYHLSVQVILVETLFLV